MSEDVMVGTLIHHVVLRYIAMHQVVVGYWKGYTTAFHGRLFPLYPPSHAR